MNRLHLSVLSFFAFVSACTTSSSGTDAATDSVRDVISETPGLPPYVDPYACPMTAGGRLALDEPLDASETRAGVITRESELIGGEGAAGRVGHLKIYNNKIRFVVQGRVTNQGMSRAVGYSLYGGNIIDADRTRPREAPGQDLFRETFPAYGFRVQGADEVAVACDGSGGRPAAIRVVGSDVASRILGVLDGVASEQYVRMVTHYILRPGSDVLEIVTEALPYGGGAQFNVASADFLGFGNALTLFSSATGFGNVSRATVPISYLVGVSDPGENNRHVSYGIAPETGPMSVPVVDASGTVALYSAVSAPAKMPARFTRFFSVGDGDVTSVVEPLLRARRTPYGTVTGRTTAGALVYAYASTYTVGANVSSIARAQMDGTWRMALEPGTYSLLAMNVGHTRGTPVSVTVTADQEVSATVTTGVTGTLVLDVGLLDSSGMRLRGPAKISLVGMGIETPDGAMGELEGERESYDLYRAIFSLNGQERITVKPGRYRATVSRGGEYNVALVDVTVAAGEEATLRAELRRVVDTTGMISGDFHQHTVGSIDSPRSLCGRVLENVAEGLEYAATTDHDNVTDFMPCVREQNLTTWFNAIRGNEVSVVGTGHFNAFPLTVNPADPAALIGAQYWADLTTQEIFDKIRRESGGPLFHVNHPRSTNLKGYFTSIALDPISLMSRRPLATGWEAIEVNESIGAPDDFTIESDVRWQMRVRTEPSAVPVLRDFFAFVSRGDHPCALGNSDTHGRNNGSGYPRNYLLVNEDRPDRVTEAMVLRAIRSQQVIVSNGILPRIRTGGSVHMGHTDVVRAMGGSVELELDVQAAPWVDAQAVVLYENGRPLSLTATGSTLRASTTASMGRWALPLDSTAPGRDGVVRLRATVRVTPTRDSYYVLAAQGGSLSPIGAGDAFGYTNPVYVDGNGWQAQ
jgi:hypothetical protein